MKHADGPILVDDTPPIAGFLFDGPYAGRDLVFTKDRNEVKKTILVGGLWPLLFKMK